MKFSSRIVVVLVAMLLCCAVNASAEWRIDFESKTVSPNETGVTVEVTTYWDLAMVQMSIPVIVREIDPGAFWTGTLPYDTTAQGGTPVGVQWNWSNPGWASLIQQVRPGYLPDQSLWCDPPMDPDYDGVSPDQLEITAQATFTSTPAEPTGRVVLTLTFDVTSTAGSFEFDTSCFTLPINSIFMVDGVFYQDHGPNGLDEVVFNKGIITIQSDNEPPVWNPIPPKDVNEGERLLFDVSASDPDGDPLTLTVEDEPATAVFTDNGDGTGTFDWTPGDTESGEYNVQFIASDGSLEDIDTVEITVNDVNAVLETGEGVPTEYALGQNFPNPFNASTRIEFALRQGGHTKLEVFNILGQNISTLVDEYLPAGSQSASWNGTNATGKVVPSGLYFYRLTAGEYTEMKKMVLMK